MKEQNVKVVIAEPWSDQKLAERVAQDGGARALVLAAGRRRGEGRRHVSCDARLQRQRARRGASSSAVAGDLLALLWVPFLMCLVLTGIHAYLGIHVIAREVVFVDIALAQIAALGATAAFLFGFEPRVVGVVRLRAWPSRSSAPLVLALTRSRERRVSQEAVIGVVYAVSAAAAVLLADRPRTAPSTCAACSWAASSPCAGARW